MNGKLGTVRVGSCVPRGAVWIGVGEGLSLSGTRSKGLGLASCFPRNQSPLFESTTSVRQSKLWSGQKSCYQLGANQDLRSGSS